MKYRYRVTVFFCLSIVFFLEGWSISNILALVSLSISLGKQALHAYIHQPVDDYVFSHKLLWSFVCWNPANHVFNLKPELHMSILDLQNKTSKTGW